MEKYKSCFDDEEIDLQVLLHMSESELDSIGIKRIGPRRKLMLAISGVCVCVCVCVCMCVVVQVCISCFDSHFF